jgi:hypothetical protein
MSALKATLNELTVPPIKPLNSAQTVTVKAFAACTACQFLIRIGSNRLMISTLNETQSHSYNRQSHHTRACSPSTIKIIL